MDDPTGDHKGAESSQVSECFASSAPPGTQGSVDDQVLSGTRCPVWFLTTKGIHCNLSMLVRGLSSLPDGASGNVELKALKLLCGILRQLVEFILDQHIAFMVREVLSHALVTSSGPEAQLRKTAAVLTHSYSVVRELATSALSCIEGASKTGSAISRCVQLASTSLADLKRAIKVVRGGEFRMLLCVREASNEEERRELTSRWCDYFGTLTVAQRGILVGWARDASTVTKLIPETYAEHLPPSFSENVMSDYSKHVFTTLIPLRGLKKVRAHGRSQLGYQRSCGMPNTESPLRCDSIKEYSDLEPTSSSSASATTSLCFMSSDLVSGDGSRGCVPVMLSSIGEGPSLSKRHSDIAFSPLDAAEGNQDVVFKASNKKITKDRRPGWITRSLKKLASIGSRRSSDS